MEWHWYIIGVIIIAVVAFQFFVYRRTRKRLSEFKNVFPRNFENDWVVDNVDGCSQFVLRSKKCDSEKIAKLREEQKNQQGSKAALERTIEHMKEMELPFVDSLRQLSIVDHRIREIDDEISSLKNDSKYDRYFQSNPTFKTIIESINVYLKKNKGNAIDYHLIKDIVDRNCDALEDEIQAQLPMPLYAGLAGTMSGVIVGVGYLWLSGGLKELLSTDKTEQVANAFAKTGEQAVTSGADGIEAVLGGIALAMLASFIGIILTTFGSWRAKSVKVQVEIGKQKFLSWLQQELLPKLKTGVDAEIGRITDNIKESNASFAANTTKLNATLKDINQAISGMTGMLHSLENLNVVQFASANIQVYEKLKNCTDELGRFAQYITSLDDFIAKIDTLSTKMGEADDRVRAIEEMGRYFRDERSNLEAMKGLISSSIGEADANLKNAVASFKDSATSNYTEMATHNEQQRQALEKAIDEQQKQLESKLKEKITQLDYISDELKKLAPIKDSVSKFESATKEQNRRIEDLAASIRELANAKSSGGNGGTGKIHFPGWAKWSLIIVSAIVGITCLTYLVPKIIALVSDLLSLI
jgi:hypothetical protein